MTGVEIRDARHDEFDELADVRVAAYIADGFLSPQSTYTQTLRALGADGLGHVLVAFEGEPGLPSRGARPESRSGRILGTVMLQGWPEGGEMLAGPEEAEIRALAVVPDARGTGLGRDLLAAIIDRAVAIGVRHLVLLTQPDMKTAHRLYEKVGFTRLPERDWSPEPGLTLLAYGLVLGYGSSARVVVLSGGRLGLPGTRAVLAMSEALPEITAAAVPADAWLLDVREADEWAAGHVPGATHIPLGQLGGRTEELPQDEEIYVICRTGVRSARVTQALNGAGWRALNVAGGMRDWVAAGRPMVTDSGAAPFVA
jgi:rhodanese-related sulfurtransferase/ribosomal protein S18 acetylase RimI-like enzyme